MADNECPICMSGPSPPPLGPLDAHCDNCQHPLNLNFHRECLNRSVDIKNACPICRNAPCYSHLPSLGLGGYYWGSVMGLPFPLRDPDYLQNPLLKSVVLFYYLIFGLGSVGLPSLLFGGSSGGKPFNKPSEFQEKIKFNIMTLSDKEFRTISNLSDDIMRNKAKKKEFKKFLNKIKEMDSDEREDWIERNSNIFAQASQKALSYLIEQFTFDLINSMSSPPHGF